jgi:hypothetical protein
MRQYLPEPPDVAERHFQALVEHRLRHIRSSIDLLGLLEAIDMLPPKGMIAQEGDLERLARKSASHGERVDPFEEIAENFVRPRAFRDSYHVSCRRIAECIELLWLCCLREELIAETRAELLAAVDDGLRLYLAYPRSHRVPHHCCEQHALLMLVATIFAGDAARARDIIARGRVDPPLYPKYPIHETMFDYLTGLFEGDLPRALALVPKLEKFKASHLIRIPTPKLLRGVAGGDAKDLLAGIRDIGPRHEKLFAKANVVLEATPTHFRYHAEFGGLQPVHRIPILDLCCLRLAARAGREIPEIVHWYPCMLRDVPWQR